MDSTTRRRIFVCIPVLILGALPQACALYTPDFGPELVAVPADQIQHEAISELQTGALAAAIEEARP